ncbi:2-pyrone-4,6-dicarboxylate hydrolase [Oleiphilus sp. HI0130]|nr:2-pyrone-4,6-dicarboxylate hydrolase [Oleiphilus sp. HI0130]
MTQSPPIFDSHLHIIDPRFPLFENQGYIPAPFSVENYLHATSNYELLGGTVVSGSFQKQDQSYLLDALEKLGKRFVGVTQLLHTCSDEDVALLNEAGVRAVRFNLKRGGSEGIKQLKNFALRLHDLAEWHVELYVDSTELEGLSPTLLSLPKVSIDHLGLSKVGIKSLLKCAEKGVHIKATGFGRIDFKPASVIQDLYKANPHCLMFGTDLPSTRAPRAFQHNDIQLIVDNLDAEAAERVLWKNALTLYKPAI